MKPLRSARVAAGTAEGKRGRCRSVRIVETASISLSIAHVIRSGGRDDASAGRCREVLWLTS
jgi:hypothetical protein